MDAGSTEGLPTEGAGLTGAGGDFMVFVKVRETYDLHTIKNKMTVIGIHTPKPDIIKANYPGLLMQCKGYRPYSCDVRIACASTLPLDPQGIGLTEGDVAPEDVFNPILFKATSNFGMSQIEARIAYLSQASGVGVDVAGPSSDADVDSFNVSQTVDDFDIYYGLLSNAHNWRHANPQSGLEMSGLKPLVYETLYNYGDNTDGAGNATAPDGTGAGKVDIPLKSIRGNGKPMPMINTTSYSNSGSAPGFAGSFPVNHEVSVPYINVMVGCIIIPPSRLHELFYRMVVEWTLEFSSVRPISEITDFSGLQTLAGLTHYINYDYSANKAAITGSSDTILENDVCMVGANVDVNKVM